MPNFGTIDECFQPDTVCHINFGLNVVVVNYLLLAPLESTYSLNKGNNSFKETFGLFYDNHGDLFISDVFYRVRRQYKDYVYDVIFGGSLLEGFCPKILGGGRNLQVTILL